MSNQDANQLSMSAAAFQLEEGMEKIEHCLGQISEEEFWWRPRVEMNSIANLLLHLAGNLQQWLVSGVGGVVADERHRPSEFTDRSNRSKAEILAKLQSVVAAAKVILASLSTQQMTQPRRIQGYEIDVAHAIWHTIPHFRGHVQEIIHMTRCLRGTDYKIDFVPKGKEQGGV